MSVLLDGTYLESANIDPGPLPPKDHGLRFFIRLTDRPAELIAHHVASAAAMAKENGTSLTELNPDDVKAVVNYGRGLSLHSLHKQGALTELPDFIRERKSEPAQAI